MWTVLSWAVKDEEPWDVGEQLGVEKESQYLEVAGEDMRKGLYRTAVRLESRWRDWSVQQTSVKLLQNSVFCSVRPEGKSI